MTILQRAVACVAAVALVWSAVPSAFAQDDGRVSSPPRRSLDPFGLNDSRLGLLEAGARPLGTTPQITPDIEARYDRMVNRIVDPDNVMDLIVGQPRLLQLKRTPLRIMIPDEQVARYQILTDTELAIAGISIGTTQLNIWFEDPTSPTGQTILSYLVRVLPDPEAKERIERAYDLLEQEINSKFPSSQVELSLVGDTLVVSGDVPDVRTAEQVMSIVRANTSPANRNVPVERFEDTFRGAGSNLVSPGMDNYGLYRELGSAEGASRQSAGGLQIINLLRVPGQQQVALKVTVAEVNRAAARSIGLNFSLSDDGGLTFFEQLTGGIATGGLANLPMILDNGQVRLAINALRTLSFAKSLAEPTLVAMQGQKATFLAGGEFPIPVVTGATSVGLQGVEFVEFGVSLEFTPYIQDRDLIRLVVGAEVSARNLTTGTEINGANVPGRDSRRFDTVVELREGQTLAVAGLIQQTFGSNGDRVPGAGDLPFLGALFGYNRTTANETELVILVTPELVSPLNPNERAEFLPGQDVYEPDDIEFFLLNRLESRHMEDARSPATTDLDRLMRVRALEKRYIMGPAGYSDGR